MRTGGGWRQQAKLLGDEGEQGFGRQVSIDGDTIVIGSYRQDSGVAVSGQVYIFARTGGRWRQQAKLLSDNDRDGFGKSIALAGDTVVVGAFEDLHYGSAYVFVRSGDVWMQQTKLLPTRNDPDVSMFFRLVGGRGRRHRHDRRTSCVRLRVGFRPRGWGVDASG